MSNQLSERHAPRGHGLYVRVRDSLPAPAADALTEFATTIRHVRMRVKLTRRRAVRRIARRGRRLRARFVRWLMRRPHLWRWLGRRPGFRGWSERHASALTAKDARRSSLWISRVLKALVPASMSLPGEGPTVALDARGLRTEEVAQYIADHDLCGRTIVIVDDPNLATLRDTNVFYEYAPETPEVPAERRMRWIVSAYGVDRIDVALPPSTAPVSKTPRGETGPAASPVNECS